MLAVPSDMNRLSLVAEVTVLLPEISHNVFANIHTIKERLGIIYVRDNTTVGDDDVFEVFAVGGKKPGWICWSYISAA